jgi:hypothetical protein
MKWIAPCIVLLAITGLGAGCGGGGNTTFIREGGSTAGGEESRPAPAFAELPTERCKTLQGYRTSPVPLQAMTPTGVPASLGSKSLAAYRNTSGTTLVAPRGWQCRSTVGVDGSESIVVALIPVKNIFEEHPEEAVSLVSIPACVGCIAKRLCPIFPKAAPVRVYSPQLPCHVKPLRENAAIIGPYTATFEDPPKIKGQGFPSGGKNAAIGMLSYSKSSGFGQITCTLPTSMSAVCPAIASAGLTALIAGP